jgi:TrmH family RNA methyltransferase
MHRVTSPQNPRIKEATRLAQSSRDRRKTGRCILEGEHLVTVYCDRVGPPETLIVADNALAAPEIAALARRVPSSDALVVPATLFGAIAALPSEIGVLAVIRTPQPTLAPPADFCLLLEDLQDPGNVGTILRTAAAAGVGQVLMSKHCAFAWSPKVLRAGQGAHFLTTVVEDVDLVAWVASFRGIHGRVIALVARGGADLFQAKLVRPLALMIGNEGAGLSARLVDAADQRVTIPMPGGTESLNAAAAAAIALFECVRQTRSLAATPSLS